jgi:hypothetical protein
VEARSSGKITHQYIKRDWLISAGVALLYARRMASTELTAATSGSGNRAGVYLAFLQLVFTLGWTTYVIYLPGLAKQVGIAPETVILILMMDQAIFTITDTGYCRRPYRVNGRPARHDRRGADGDILRGLCRAAVRVGHPGAEGKVIGLVFSALALATFARMAAVAGGLQKLPEYAPLLHWAPVACWSVAGAGLLVIAAARLQQGARP